MWEAEYVCVCSWGLPDSPWLGFISNTERQKIWVDLSSMAPCMHAHTVLQEPVLTPPVINWVRLLVQQICLLVKEKLVRAVKQKPWPIYIYVSTRQTYILKSERTSHTKNDLENIAKLMLLDMHHTQLDTHNKNIL